MKKAILMLFVLLPPNAVAQAINLPQWEGMPMVTKTANYLGKCGSAVVSVEAVSRVGNDYYEKESNGALKISNLKINQVLVFDSLGAKLRIRGGTEQDLASRRIRSPLSDHNGIACIDTGNAHKVQPGAKMILIWSRCSGSMCGEDWSFTIINPETLAIEGAAVGSGGGDTNFAARKLGYTKLPLNLK